MVFLENLESYLKGERVKFKVRMDLWGLTKFQREVLKECSKIPWGKTRSYAELARSIGNPKASRAVGQAVGRNPIPVVIPCHRVLASGGRMGGFGSGLGWKRFLLNLEGIRIEVSHP
jgi:methylated-DNA-[protein]-cysteine S-methyltransferase